MIWSGGSHPWLYLRITKNFKNSACAQESQDGKVFKSSRVVLMGARLRITRIHNTTFSLYKVRNSHREGRTKSPKISQLYMAEWGLNLELPRHTSPTNSPASS